MVELKLVTPSFLEREDQDHLWWVCEAIKAALEPWSPGKITFYTSEYFGPFNPTLTVETELLPRLPFSMQMDMLAMDEHLAMSTYANAAYDWFRYRHIVPVEDHIVLGEE